MPPQWNDVVSKALARDRGLRYSSASEFLRAIERAASAAGTTARIERVHQWGFWSAWAGIAAALLLPALAGVSRFAQTPPPHAITFHIAPPDISQPSSAPLVEAKTSSIQRERIVAKPNVPRQQKSQQVSVVLRRQIPEKPDQSSVALAATPASNKPFHAATTLPDQPALIEPAQIASAPTETGVPVPEPSAPHKHRFWKKLNPFKRGAKTEVGETPSPAQ